MRARPLFFIFFLATPAFAAVRLETSLEPREATVGDPLTLRVKARSEPPGDCRMDLGGIAGPFTVVSASSGPEKQDGSLVEREFQFTLAAFDVGVSTLPALSVRCQEGKTALEVKTPAIPVTIRSVLTPDSKDIRGLKGRLRRVLNRWALGGLLLGLGVVGGFILWFRSRSRRPGARLPGPPPVPPHQKALGDLRLLEEELTIPAKLFYSRLTDILRAYLEGAFRVPATDRTTAEIATELKSLSIPYDQRQGLREALEDGDLAKFAKLDPSMEERLKDFERVRDFVLATQPREAST